MSCKFLRWIWCFCWIVFVATMRTRALLSGCCSSLHGKRWPIIITVETIVVCICGDFLHICSCCKRIFPTGLDIPKDDNILYVFRKLFCISSIVCFYPQIGVGLSSSLPASLASTTGHSPGEFVVFFCCCCSGYFCELCFFESAILVKTELMIWSRFS